MILALFSVSFVVGAALGLNIPECDVYGKVTILEGNETVISCMDFAENVTVQWSVIYKNGSNISFGTYGNFTTSLNNSDFRIEQNLSNTCTLRILRNHRAMAGTIRCSEENDGAFADCSVIVEYPANIDGCSLQTNTEDWKVFGICNITKVFSSDNVYSCQWYRKREKMDFRDFLPGHLNLSDFYDSTGQVYKNGTCSVETDLGEAGKKTFSISVPFTSSSMFVGTINIDYPDKPETNCPVYVAEGRTLSCDCLPNSSRPGNPPPVLTWSGLNSSHLQIDRVQSGDGQNFTCKLTWGPNQTFVKETQYTIQIAYPPKSYPIITGYNTNQVLSVGSTVVISCSATGGKPPISSVKLFCGKYQSHSDVIMHESKNLTQITVTCNVTMNVTSTDNGTICTCRAIWDPDPDLPSLKTLITLLVANKNQLTLDEIDGSSKEGTQSAAIIGGVIGAALFVIIVIATVVIFIKICNKSSDTRTDEIVNDDVDNDNYDDLRLPEVGLRSSYASFHVCNNDKNDQSTNDEFYNNWQRENPNPSIYENH